MRRRQILASIAASSFGASVVDVRADERPCQSSREFAIQPNSDNATILDFRSQNVIETDQDSGLVWLGACTFALSVEGRLSAKIHARVTQSKKLDCWISVAVFDSKRKFLGAASHKEEISVIAIGKVITLERELEFHFGYSDCYRSMSHIAIAICHRGIPV